MATHRARIGSMPAGLAFALDELVFARAWAERRGLSFSILLGQTHAGQEFEEVIVIRRHVPTQMSMALWRQPWAVIVQPEAGMVRRFAGLPAALAHVGRALSDGQTARSGPRLFRLPQRGR